MFIRKVLFIVSIMCAVLSMAAVCELEVDGESNTEENESGYEPSDEEPSVGEPSYYVDGSALPTSDDTGEYYEATFQIGNNGNGAGIENIDWTVYLSSDETLSADDIEVATGEAPGIFPTEFSENWFEGTYPNVAGSYYFIILIDSDEDIDSTDNLYVSEAVQVTTPAPPNYQIANGSYPDGTFKAYGSPYTIEFDVENIGSGSGSADIDYKIYLLHAAVYPDVSAAVPDHEGTIPGLAVGELQSISVNGTHDIVNGFGFYTVVVINAADDEDDSNDRDEGPYFDVGF